MKKYIIFLLFCLLLANTGCKRLGRVESKKLVTTITKDVAHNVLTHSEKDLGKALYKATSVLSQESREYLLKLFSENPKLFTLFKENPRFVSSWDYLRKHLPSDCKNPEFLKLFIHANDYQSYGGNKIENYVYKKLKNGTIEVFSKGESDLLATIKPGNVIEVMSDNVNNWFLQLKPFPNAKYIIRDAEYVTDDLGRVVSAKSKIEKKCMEGKKFRDSSVQRKMADLKKSGFSDDAGHLIGNQFGGSTNMINLVPMSSTLNRQGGAFAQIEQQISKAIKEGKEVVLDIELKYPAKPINSERPEWIVVTYVIDGIKTVKPLKNIA